AGGMASLIFSAVAWQNACVLAMALGLAAGCAEHLEPMHHAEGWSTGMQFWPPPPATSSWLAEASTSPTLGEAAQFANNALRSAGYADQRWFPIGAQYSHGFAVTTRVERIDGDGTPTTAAERWSPAYPYPATLRWLAGSAEPYLPKPGRYRVLL